MTTLWTTGAEGALDLWQRIRPSNGNSEVTLPQCCLFGKDSFAASGSGNRGRVTTPFSRGFDRVKGG